jgi:hypothetical protein
MVELSEKQLAEWKALFDKEGISYQSDEEVFEMVDNLTGFFDVLIQMDLESKNKATKEAA